MLPIALADVVNGTVYNLALCSGRGVSHKWG